MGSVNPSYRKFNLKFEFTNYSESFFWWYISGFFLGATRTNAASELLFARQYVVTVAKAFNLQAIDLVYINYKGKLLSFLYPSFRRKEGILQ